ncbi:MAG: type II toxin-antitoxin system prevent-host-death family antitoxin [Caldilineales bacterium]|nr:type II toxin-antitoxin system prevent-host-death family antitoxin [Caldilineales bacterium]MCW5858139.1 type II toxin-antitoxin system prevent-host-death family antitoxin [Caldilineales bacterium]
MTHQVLNSDDARTRWRDILDAAGSGQDVVIARYGKPMAAVVPIADYEALREELEDLRAARRAQAALEAWRQDSSRGRPYAELRQELVTEGLLEHE